jgi:hypothetical protein
LLEESCPGVELSFDGGERSDYFEGQEGNENFVLIAEDFGVRMSFFLSEMRLQRGGVGVTGSRLREHVCRLLSRI